MFSQFLRQGRRFCLSGESGVQIRLSAAKRGERGNREEAERTGHSWAMFQEQEAKEEAVRHMEELDAEGGSWTEKIWHRKPSCTGKSCLIQKSGKKAEAFLSLQALWALWPQSRKERF